MVQAKESEQMCLQNRELLKGLIFDLLYDQYRGVIIYIRIFAGELNVKQRIKFLANNKVYRVEKLGVKIPQEIEKQSLITGEIG